MRWRRYALVAALASLLVLASPVGALVHMRLAWPPPNRLELRSIAERLEAADVAWSLIVRHPLLGVGGGNYLHVVLHEGALPQHTHHVPLLVVAELVPGLLALLLGLAGLLAEARHWQGDRSAPG